MDHNDDSSYCESVNFLIRDDSSLHAIFS
jgi:hypothetical protein